MLLEQVVSSTVERCVDPQLMEQSVSKVYHLLSSSQLMSVMCNRWWRLFANVARKLPIFTSLKFVCAKFSFVYQL